jgi:hypothetical protein
MSASNSLGLDLSDGKDATKPHGPDDKDTAPPQDWSTGTADAQDWTTGTTATDDWSTPDAGTGTDAAATSNDWGNVEGGDATVGAEGERGEEKPKRLPPYINSERVLTGGAKPVS